MADKSYTEEGFSGSTRTGKASGAESGGPAKRTRRTPMPKEYEIREKSRGTINLAKVKAQLDAERRQQEADLASIQSQQEYEQQKGLLRQEQQGAPSAPRRQIVRRYQKPDAEQTATYQKHTLIALTTAFLITFGVNKIMLVTSKVKPSG